MNVLLLNYDFPPNPGIGGRRWAKLAKAMAQQGHTIHVVKAEFPVGAEPSSWAEDVNHENISITSAPRNYPKAISHPVASLWGKIKFHIHKQLLKLKESGTIYDQSIGWDSTAMPICRNILNQHNIDTIIATGAPWNLLVYAARLKKEFPGCNLLIDYRDPWLTARNYGMANLSGSRKKAEESKQSFVFEQADFVCTPYAYLTEQLSQWSSLHCAHQPAFHTLDHFFDPSDFSTLQTTRKEDAVFRVVYAGDAYIGSEPQWQELQRIIQAITAENKDRINIQFDLYTTAKLPAFMSTIPNVHAYAPIGKSIFNIMQQADVLLIVLPENKKNERTTKFFEYLPFRKPLLVVAPLGEVTNYIESNQLGVHSNQSLPIIQSLFNGDYAAHSFNSSFDLSCETNVYRTQQMMEMLS
jgi:hypothetical protein